MQINGGDEECIQNLDIKTARKTASRQSEEKDGQYYDESQRKQVMKMGCGLIGTRLCPVAVYCTIIAVVNLQFLWRVARETGDIV